MDLAGAASRMAAARRLAAAVATLLVAAAGCTAAEPGPAADRTAAAPAGAAPAPPSAAETAPRYLQGRPLAGPTRLRLLVASDPPRLLDVDRGTSRRVGGLPAGRDGFADGNTHVDPGTGRALARYPEIHGVVGDLVLWGGPERHAGPFTLTDRRSGARHPVTRPTPHGVAGFGTASPDGRLLAVEFADVSWGRVQGQVSDIWLLDLPTRRWRRLPGMPLITAVKFMSMAWAGDGRLVLAGTFDRFGEAVVVWRPGQDHLAIKRLDLPRYDGSDSFVAWPAAGA